MTRAEEAALKAYPVRTYRKDQGEPEYSSDYNANDRYRFQEGYEQAEKGTIERAVAWLKENANKYIVDLTETYPEAPVNIIVGGMCWEDLTKYLKSNEQV